MRRDFLSHKKDINYEKMNHVCRLVSSHSILSLFTYFSTYKLCVYVHMFLSLFVVEN